jgi:hypothetical protein
MKYLKKKIASWEIKYGQIAITGRDYEIAKKIFGDYFSRTFELETFRGSFPNRHFLHEDTRNSLRLACKPFFSVLNEGDIIYLQPIDSNKIGVYKDEPVGEIEKIEDREEIEAIPVETGADVTKLLVGLVKENKALREENEELIRYKDRLEKYQNLEYIFEDEQFMEDWLERNIHKALANLEIIDRQPVVTWNESFMRNKPDFFCLDKTTIEINKKYEGKNLKATENFRFVIITDTTDERLEAICEDNGITLILIDGGVVFEEIVPYYFK